MVFFSSARQRLSAFGPNSRRDILSDGVGCETPSWTEGVHVKQLPGTHKGNSSQVRCPHHVPVAGHHRKSYPTPPPSRGRQTPLLTEEGQDRQGNRSRQPAPPCSSPVGCWLASDLRQRGRSLHLLSQSFITRTGHRRQSCVLT